MALCPDAKLLQQEIERDVSRPRELTDIEIQEITKAKKILRLS
jgi:hypothetical protein